MLLLNSLSSISRLFRAIPLSHEGFLFRLFTKPPSMQFHPGGFFHVPDPLFHEAPGLCDLAERPWLLDPAAAIPNLTSLLRDLDLVRVEL